MDTTSGHGACGGGVDEQYGNLTELTDRGSADRAQRNETNERSQRVDGLAADLPGPARYGAIVLLELLPAWLSKTRAERTAATERLRPILERYDDVVFRWFDADALGHGYSDFVLCEFSDLERYNFLWEEIRDTEFFTVPLARMKQVVLGIEQGYRRFEASVAE